MVSRFAEPVDSVSAAAAGRFWGCTRGGGDGIELRVRITRTLLFDLERKSDSLEQIGEVANLGLDLVQKDSGRLVAEVLGNAWDLDSERDGARSVGSAGENTAEPLLRETELERQRLDVLALLARLRLQLTHDGLKRRIQ